MSKKLLKNEQIAFALRQVKTGTLVAKMGRKQSVGYQAKLRESCPYAIAPFEPFSSLYTM